MKITEYDALTDTTTERDATSAELKAYEAEVKEAEKTKAEKEAQESIAAAKKSDLLARLGITAEEAKLLA